MLLRSSLAFTKFLPSDAVFLPWLRRTLETKCLFRILSFFSFLFLSFFFFFWSFLGLYLQHMEVPRLGVHLELQLLAYTTATAMRNLNHICNLHHSSWPHRILNPLNKLRGWTHILMNTSQVHNPLSHNENSLFVFYVVAVYAYRIHPSENKSTPMCSENTGYMHFKVALQSSAGIPRLCGQIGQPSDQ